VPVRRLTAGWRDTGRAASLAEHTALFGPMPEHGRVRRSLIAQISEAGLTGRGGAGFPTAVKMRSVAARRRRAVVVANGMESEPASSKDQALLARAPHLILDGAVLAAEAVGADVAYLCLSQARRRQADDVRLAVDERGDGDPARIEVCELPGRYVSSTDTALVSWLNGGDARPVFTPLRPDERGVRSRPTLVDNVETLANVALIARYGAAWHRQAGTAQTPGTMLVTLSGAVGTPGVYEVEIGTPVGNILAAAQSHASSDAVLVGGFFGTWHDMAEVAGLPLSEPGLRPVGGSPGAGVLVVLPPGACGLAAAARCLRYLASEGAEQCGPCMFGLPAIAGDLSDLAAGRADSGTLSRLERRFGLIAGRGACHHPDGAVRMAASALRAFAADARVHAYRRPCLAGPGAETTPLKTRGEQP
jgi:NADH:ubiquinone oxidoreductase subunit F (NADH-binding)